MCINKNLGIPKIGDEMVVPFITFFSLVVKLINLKLYKNTIFDLSYYLIYFIIR